MIQLERASKNTEAERKLDVLAKAWESFDNYRQESGTRMNVYISEFEAKWRKAEAAGVENLGEKARVLMLLQ